MRAYQFPYPETEQMTVVSRFGGVDFRTHPTKVSLARSPDMQNMICDQNDFLVKRTGWKTQDTYTAPIYGLFPMPDGSGFAVHAGSKLFFRPMEGTQTELCTDMKQAFSQAFVMSGVLYLLDGQTYRAVQRNEDDDGWEAVKVQDIAYVPTTTISAAPTGGGTSYEDVNLLTPKRINTFIGNGSATQFQVDAKDLDNTTVTAEVDGEAVTVSSVNRSTGLVTLSSAPPNGNGLATYRSVFPKPWMDTRIKSTSAALPACMAARTTRACSSPATRTSPIATGRAVCTTRPISPIWAIPAWERMRLRSSATSSSMRASWSSSRAVHRRQPAICAPT